MAAWKVGFLGSAEGVSAVAEILSDYPDVPLVAYMPNLSWVEEDDQQAYLDAFRELVLPQTEVLVGNHQTLTDLLLPDWDGERPASPRELAVAAAEHGTRFVLVTGLLLPAAKGPSQFLDNVLASPQGAITGEKFERFEVSFRRRGRHAVGRAGRAAGLGRRTARRRRRSAGLPRPGARRGLPPRHGQRGSRPLLLGPAAGRRRRAGAPPTNADFLATCPRARDMSTETQDQRTSLFDRAQNVIPGGVNSPVRAFRAVGGTPRFIARAQGAYMFDAEGRALHRLHRLLGPDDPGPRPPGGAGCGAEGRARRLLVRRADRARDRTGRGDPVAGAEHGAGAPGQLGHRGGDERDCAWRAAPPGRSKIIKFEGCYHGHADALLVKAGSGLATFGHPTSAGVPPEVVQHTLVLEYNNVTQLEEAFSLHGSELACVMIEPIAGNMNFVRASVPFMTAAARAVHAARRAAGVRRGDDGLPRRAGQRAERVRQADPRLRAGHERVRQGHRWRHAAGGVWRQAGGDGAARAARARCTRPARCRATRWPRPAVWPRCARSPSRASSTRLGQRTRSLVSGLLGAAKRAGVPMVGDCEGGMFGFFFGSSLPQNYPAVIATDKERFNRFFHAMLESRRVLRAGAVRSRLRQLGAHRRRHRRHGGRRGTLPARLMR